MDEVRPGCSLCFLKYQEDDKRYLKQHMLLYLIVVGGKCTQMYLFLGCITHTPSWKMVQKSKIIIRKKSHKWIKNHFEQDKTMFLWHSQCHMKIFSQCLKTLLEEKHIRGSWRFLLFLNYKAKFFPPHSLLFPKKKSFENFTFLFTAVLAKVKPSFTLTSRSLLRLGFHFSIAAISQGMYKRLQGS